MTRLEYFKRIDTIKEMLSSNDVDLFRRRFLEDVNFYQTFRVSGDLDKPLFLYACQYGLLDAVKCMVNEFNFDISVKSGVNWTALHYAVKSCNIELLEFLLQVNSKLEVNKKVDLNYCSDNGTYALFEALSYHNVEIARLLLSYGASTQVNYDFSFSSLDSKDFSAVKKTLTFILEETDISFLSKFKLLKYFILSKNTEAIELCLLHKDRFNINVDGCALLGLAVKNGYWDIFRLLLKFNSPNLLGMTSYHDTTFSLVLRSGSMKEIEYLFDTFKVDKDYYGFRRSDVLSACLNDLRYNVAKFLLDKGYVSLSDDCNRLGDTILHAICLGPNERNFDFLSSNYKDKLDFSLRGYYGFTPLHNLFMRTDNYEESIPETSRLFVKIVSNFKIDFSWENSFGDSIAVYFFNFVLKSPYSIHIKNMLECFFKYNTSLKSEKGLLDSFSDLCNKDYTTGNFIKQHDL